MSGAIAGVDVGGTNTDAVVVDRDGTIRARIKVPTTPDPAEGIVDALRQVVGSRSVARVSFGTTHALNAIVRRQGLRRVALIRLGSPGTEAIPPLTGWPDDLAAATSAGAWIARGGVEIDGRHVAVDPAEIVRIAGEIASDGAAGAIAVVGTFSPLDPAQERQTAARLAEATGLPVSISSEIGGLGLLERENATVLNAALGDLVERLVNGLVTATSRLGGRHTRLPHPERRYVDDDRPCPPRARAHGGSRSVQQPARRRRALGKDRRPHRGCRGHERRRRSARSSLPPGVGRRSRDRRRADELPHARSGLGACGRRHDHPA